LSEFLTVEELKPGDLLVQTHSIFEGESKFIIFVGKVSSGIIAHWHINIPLTNENIIRIKKHTCRIDIVRKPQKSELTEEVIRQYKRTLMKLILKGII